MADIGCSGVEPAVNASGSGGGFELAALPVAHMTDLCGFLPELATELATAQTTQDVEVEHKQNHLFHLKVTLWEEF